MHGIGKLAQYTTCHRLGVSMSMVIGMCISLSGESRVESSVAIYLGDCHITLQAVVVSRR